MPPPGPTGAEQERHHEAHEEPSSPTQVPSDEGTSHVPKHAAQPPEASGHPEIPGTDTGTWDF
eukprot:934247-Pyramimonas_sp.AAC.1